MKYMDAIAPSRDAWVKKNRYYYDDLLKFLRFNIPEGSSVLEIGCGTGDVLNGVKPLKGLGIDISSGMINIARQKYPHLEFVQMDAERLCVNRIFDYIVISDTLGYFEDIQKVFMNLRKVSTPDTRIIITYHNFM